MALQRASPAPEHNARRLLDGLLTISHIDIKHELAQLRLECSLEERLPVFRSGRVDWPDLKTGGVQLDDVVLELFGVGERVVPDVDVVLERQGELAVGEVLGRDCSAVQVAKAKVSAKVSARGGGGEGKEQAGKLAYRATG